MGRSGACAILYTPRREIRHELNPRRATQSPGDEMTVKQIWKLRKLLGDLSFVHMWNDYSVRGHLSHYGSLTARLAEYGLTVDELLPDGWDPREIWRRTMP